MEELDLNKKTSALIKGLLDTGKRTNLINYKDNKTSSVEVFYPAMEELFDLVVRGNNLTIKNYSNELKKALKDENNPTTTKQFIADKVNETGSNELLIYNSKVDDPFIVLKNLIKRNRSYVLETGVNLCYITLGFIRWRDNESSSSEIFSPLLLIPISVEANSQNTAFTLSFLSDDIITNDSLIIKFKSDFGINLPKFAPEVYPDIKEYFDEVDAIISTQGFTTTNDCRIGLFSFSNINIYNDIVENQDKLLANENVRLLLGDTNCEPPIYISEDKIKEKKQDFLELHNVIDADSSQMMAILNAKQGNTFVLQGPPGTGKSQTITNLIAECLYEGKTVLFVSEKQAALNVVFDKLRNIGLEDACLELHSEKSNKKEVIAELARTLTLDSINYNESADYLVDERDILSKELDQYSDELHKVNQQLRMSLYDLYEEMYKYGKALEVNYIISDITSKDSNFINETTRVLEYYINYTKTIGEDYHKNIWYGFIKESSTRTDLIELDAGIKDTNVYLHKLNNISERIDKTAQFAIKSIDDADRLSKGFEILSKSEMISPVLLTKVNDPKFYELLDQTIEVADVYNEEKSKLDEVFDKDVYQMDGRKLSKKLSVQYNSFFSRLFSKEYKTILSDLRLATKDGHKVKYDEALVTLQSLAKFQEANEAFEANKSSYNELFLVNYDGVSSNFKTLRDEMNSLWTLKLSNESIIGLSSLDLDTYEKDKEVFNEIHQDLDRASNEFVKSKEYLKPIINSSILNIDEYDLQHLICKFNVLGDNVETYHHWAKFINLYKELEQLGLVDYVDLAIEEHLSPMYIVPTYKKIFYHEWIDECLKDCPKLGSLPRNMHDEIIKKFQNADKVSFEINKSKIRSKLSASRPSMQMVSKGSPVSTILRENEKKRRKMPIKQLFAEVPDLILKIKPCLLMSPLSVSTYIPADLQFDLVVFDEASQILPGHALGALYRGKQHIIVGDSKQMPPTSFFSTTFNEDEVDDTVNDYESILDLASAVYPTVSLKWHYRSKYEQLIAFSNKNFYQNNLISFPSTLTDKKGIGVDFVYVEDGVFNRKGRNNKKEALKVVNILADYIRKYPNRSVGIVAFSQSQQDLIDSLFEERVSIDRELQDYLVKHNKETIFVKNLETVQGDERDTIIFSVGYGPDETGKLLMNFGPINTSGGERRLNVAFTRAREHVILVSSMKFTDIDLKRTQAKGSELLREYLDFAENGEEALLRSIKVNEVDVFDSPFEVDVYDFLIENGYSVDTQVGCSSYKIDMCVKKPGTSDYVLAIECDGASYHSSVCARDRDRLRQSILENMGWKFYRIWSTDWFYDNKVEKAKLLAAVEKAFKESSEKSDKDFGTTAKPELDLTHVFEKKVEVEQFEFDTYELANESVFVKLKSFDHSTLYKADGSFDFSKLAEADHYKRNGRAIYCNLLSVVKTEGPIDKKWLLKRYCYMFERQSCTKVVIEKFDYLCELYSTSHSLAKIIEKDGFLFYEEVNYPQLRVNTSAQERDVKYICPQELANGMLKIVELNSMVTKEGLYKELATRLGRKALNNTLKTQFDGAFKLISNYVEVDADDMVTLKA